MEFPLHPAVMFQPFIIHPENQLAAIITEIMFYYVFSCMFSLYTVLCHPYKLGLVMLK